MPHRLVLDAPRRLALLAFEGPVDGAEIAAASAHLLDLAGPGPVDLVCDLTGVTGLHLAPGDLDRILAAKLEHAPQDADPQRDVVIAARSLDVLMANFYAMLARRRGLPAHVCRSREEARAWLGVTDLPDEPPPP